MTQRERPFGMKLVSRLNRSAENRLSLSCSCSVAAVASGRQLTTKSGRAELVLELEHHPSTDSPIHPPENPKPTSRSPEAPNPRSWECALTGRTHTGRTAQPRSTGITINLTNIFCKSTLPILGTRTPIILT